MTLNESQRTILIMSCSVLLKMRNISEKSYRENEKTHFIFNNLFPKILPIMR